MPGNEKVDFDLAVQVAELRADVRHVQSDTTEIKAGLRATNQRVDSLSQKMDDGLNRLEQKFDARFQRVDDKFEQLRESLASAKVWALGLYIALAGSLFYVLAHGFRWL
jgi:septal ring factor EnvC (AmiA/AmiB activator)